MIADIRHLADTTNTSKVAVRARLKLPATDTSQIVLVTNDSICTRARQVVDSLIHADNPSAPNPLPSRAFYVIRIGSVFAVRDPGSHMGEYSPIDFFDEHWTWLSTMTY
jgi:hypothetical protein